MNGKAEFTFQKPIITGIVTTVGAELHRFADEASMFSLNDKEIQRLIQAVGINERRIIKNKATTTADLCVQSATSLLSGLSVSPQSIDALILVTQSPDYAAPSTAISIQHRLGLNVSSMAFDMRLGCSGFVYGLSVAYSLIESGLERIILCVGDVASRFVPPNDHSITPIMGDAGCAIMIEKGKSTSHFQLYSDGSGERALYIPNSGLRNVSEDKDLPVLMKMDGPQVFNFTLQRVPQMIDSVIQYSKVQPDEIDYFVLHQPNKYILNNIQKRMGVPDSKFPKTTQSVYGNQNSASIPGTISGFLNTAYETGRIQSLFAGFGIGLSWGSCILETNKIFVPPVQFEDDQK